MTDSIYLSSVCTLWYKPGQTLQGLIKRGRGHGLALAVAMGFGLVQAGRVYLGQPEAGLGHFVIGAVAGLVGLYLFAWLLRNFSRWFGGQSDLRGARIALGWGLLPWTLLFLALTFVIGGAAEAEALAQAYWLFFIGFLYGYVILLISLSAALNLSVLKTFFCLVVTVLVSVFPLTLLLQLLASLS